MRGLVETLVLASENPKKSNFFLVDLSKATSPIHTNNAISNFMGILVLPLNCLTTLFDNGKVSTSIERINREEVCMSLAARNG